ncbi:MAG: hypothetical protein ACK52C_00515 [Planctomycetia bacterium]
MPTVVHVSPRASAGSQTARTSGGPAAMIRQALAHCVSASAGVRQRSAIATSYSMITITPDSVPQQ